MTKPMSAKDYRAHAEQVKNERPTEIVTLNSGSVFELRRPNIQAWVMTGRVPQSLLEQGMKAWQDQGKVPVVQPKKPEVVIDAAVFALMVVQECTVNPKLVEFPDPEKNEIGPTTMLEEDFNEIFAWAMNYEGVKGFDGLESFRGRQKRRTAGSKSRGKKQRGSREQSIEPVGTLQRSRSLRL